MKKESSAGDSRQTQEQNTGTKRTRKDLTVAVNINNKPEVKDPVNVKHCRFFNKYVWSCYDADCPYSDTCEAFTKLEVLK